MSADVSKQCHFAMSNGCLVAPVVESFSPISKGRMFDFYPFIFLPNDTKLPGQTLQELTNSTLEWEEKTEETNCLGSYLGQAFEQVKARGEVRMAKRKATPSPIAKLERKEPLPGEAPTTKKVESKPEELPEEESPPKSKRKEAPELVKVIYQQLFSNKEWVKQLKVLHVYIAATISFEQWLKGGVEKFVDVTFEKFGYEKTSEDIREETFANNNISIYLFRQLLRKPHVSNRLAFIPANAVRGARFLVKHKVTNLYIVAVERDGNFTFEGIALVLDLYIPIISWKEEEKKRQRRQESSMSGRTQQAQPVWGMRLLHHLNHLPFNLNLLHPMRPRTK